MILDFSIPVITAPLCAFTVTYLSILWLLTRKSPGILDHPNTRSLHVRPVPRSGGIGLMLGIVTTWIVFSAAMPLLVWLGIGLLVVISLADDIFNISPWNRLIIHGIVASCTSILLLVDDYSWEIILLFAIAIIWFINLYNFMDGADGLAGGMTVIGFSCYGLLALLAEHNELAIINFSIAASATAFLIHNFYPARIFMGDTGSIFLGFMAAVIGMFGWVDGLWSWCLPIIIFFPFVADASITIIKRSVHREKIWHPHCEHYYQRIIQGGLGQRNTALFLYMLMLLASISALWVAQQSSATQYLVVAVWMGIYLAAMFFYDRHQNKMCRK